MCHSEDQVAVYIFAALSCSRECCRICTAGRMHRRRSAVCSKSCRHCKPRLSSCLPAWNRLSLKGARLSPQQVPSVLRDMCLASSFVQPVALLSASFMACAVYRLVKVHSSVCHMLWQLTSREGFWVTGLDANSRPGLHSPLTLLAFTTAAGLCLHVTSGLSDNTASCLAMANAASP